MPSLSSSSFLQSFSWPLKMRSWPEHLTHDRELLVDDFLLEIAEAVSDPSISNAHIESLLQLTLDHCDHELNKKRWLMEVLESSLWETGRLSYRLSLVQSLASQYDEWIRIFESDDQRHGGLLLLACEAGSWEAIEWAYQRQPNQIQCHGAYLSNPWHCIQEQRNESVFQQALLTFPSWGVDLEARNLKGETPLFRCQSEARAWSMIALGADPWVTNTSGSLSLLAFWLQTGLVDLVLSLLHLNPDRIPDTLWHYEQPWDIESPSLRSPLLFILNPSIVPRSVYQSALLFMTETLGLSWLTLHEGQRLDQVYPDDDWIRSHVESALLSHHLLLNPSTPPTQKTDFHSLSLSLFDSPSNEDHEDEDSGKTSSSSTLFHGGVRPHGSRRL